MATIVQIGKQLQRDFEKWEIKKDIRGSSNEENTRDFLIEPFLESLGYIQRSNYFHEFPLEDSEGRNRKIDMVIALNGKTPLILIECKRATKNLTTANFNQLANYFDNHKDSKIGLLTNGIIYKFYAVSWNNDKKLNDNPFFTFDLENFTRADLDYLANFHKNIFEPKKILELANEEYFANDFDEALVKTLHDPENDLLKIIYQNMGGGQTSDKTRNRLRIHLNSISIQSALENIQVLEGEKTGIVTTLEERDAFTIIKTLLVGSNTLLPHAERILFKDLKGQFKIMIDGMQSKEICNLKLTDSSKTITIEGVDYALSEVSAVSLKKYKTKLIKSAHRYI